MSNHHRTLITGINGFLANRLIDFCDGEVFGLSRYDNHKTDGNKECTTLYGDVLDFDGLKRILSDYEITHVYHLAAQSIVRIANTNPLYCFTDNVIGTTNVLESVRQINPKIKVVCASSDKSYGEHKNLPYTEDMALQSGDPYSTSKACADLVAQSYHKTYGINVNIVRSANIYGGGDMNLSRLIPSTITKILRKEKPVIYSGVMNYKREFVHVDDVCSAYKVISERGVAGEAYNVGTSAVCTISELVNKICELMNWENGIDVVEKSFPEITTQYLSSKKISDMSWSPEISFEDGLKKTINWYTEKFKK